MIVVGVDALVDALACPPGSQPVRDRLAHEELHAPAALDAEVVAVTAALERSGSLSPARAHELLDDLDALRVRRWAPAAALRARDLQLRLQLPARAAGSAAWVALAQALGAPLLVRDAALAASCAHLVAVEVL